MYRNIGDSMRNPYAREKLPPGSRGTPDAPGTPGYRNPYAPPGGGEPMPPGTGHPPLPPPQPPQDDPWVAPTPPSATDPGLADSHGGPAGVGGSGGFGFTNIQQYMYANPTATGPGSGYSAVPNGMKPSDYNSGLLGFAPSGAYSPGMASVDNALNGAYGKYAPQFYQDPMAPTPHPAPPAPDDPNHGLGPPPTDLSDLERWAEAYKNKPWPPPVPADRTYDNNKKRGV